MVPATVNRPSSAVPEIDPGTLNRAGPSVVSATSKAVRMGVPAVPP